MHLAAAGMRVANQLSVLIRMFCFYSARRPCLSAEGDFNLNHARSIQYASPSFTYQAFETTINTTKKKRREIEGGHPTPHHLSIISLV